MSPRHVTSSPEFRRWFRDSKVVDEQGRPLVVYHGTETADIEVFDPAFGNDNAVYFSRDPSVASWFSVNLGRIEDSMPNVIPAYLSIQNPKEITLEVLKELVGDEDDSTGIDWTSISNVVEAVRREGYDGIRFIGVREYNGSTADQWLAFESPQVKSAIGNCGAFNPECPQIHR